MKTALKQTLLSVFLTFLLSLPLFYGLVWASLHGYSTGLAYPGLRVVRFVVMLVLAVRVRKQYQNTPHKSWNVSLVLLLLVGIFSNHFFQHLRSGIFATLSWNLSQSEMVQFVTLEQFSYPDLYWGLLLSLEIVFLTKLPKYSYLSTANEPVKRKGSE